MLSRLVLAVLFLAGPALHAGDRAVLVYPREPWSFRRVFYTPHQRILMKRLRSTYSVDVHEQVATADELFAIDVRGAKLLVLSAHGDPFSMAFSGRQQRTIDGSMESRMAAFFGQLDPDATIVLQSCHTGRGFAHAVKKAAGPFRRVIAARGEVPRDGVEITSLSPFDAKITCRDDRRTWDCTLRLE